MNAVAAVFGEGGVQASHATVRALLDRMPERAAGHRVVLAGDGGVVGSAGPSPAFGTRAGSALAGDLRLDNARELRSELGLPSDAADPVIVLEAFDRWGDAFAERLAGDFAFVILDGRARRLVAVRDPLGIRPLLYRSGPGSLRCASELRALVEPGDGPDEGFLAEALGGDIVDTEGTPYLPVRRVPAGHMLVADASGPRITRYWEPPRDTHRGALSDHADRFRAAFDEAVRVRAEGLGAVGLHLSGGLDSSSVLASLCENRIARPIAGSLTFPWPEADERVWFEAAAGRWSVAPITVQPPSDPAAHDLDAVARHGDLPDYPTGGPLFLPLHRAMREAGASVVLTGFGGDQWWTGEMAHMADLMRRGRFGQLRHWRASGADLGVESAWSWESFARDGLLPLVPRLLRRGLRQVAPAALPGWIDPAFARRVDLRDRLRRRPDTRDAPSESWRRLRWRLDSGEEAVSKDRYDRLALASAVELRHPFYDRRLVDVAFTTPDDAKIGERFNRAVMRAGMGRSLAPETATRVTKADVSRMLIEAARAPEVQPHLAMPTLTELGWINTRAAQGLVTRVLDAGDATAALRLWRIIGVEALLAGAFGAR